MPSHEQNSQEDNLHLSLLSSLLILRGTAVSNRCPLRDILSKMPPRKKKGARNQADILNHDIPGLRLINPTQFNWESNASAVAGVMDFENTEEVWSFMQRPAVNPLLRLYGKTRRANFGMDQKKHDYSASLNAKAIITQSLDEATLRFFLQNEIPRQRKNISEANLGHIVTGNLIIKIIKTSPEVFRDSTFGTTSSKTHFHPDDIFRVYALLRLFWKICKPDEHGKFTIGTRKSLPAVKMQWIHRINPDAASVAATAAITDDAEATADAIDQAMISLIQYVGRETAQEADAENNNKDDDAYSMDEIDNDDNESDDAHDTDRMAIDKAVSKVFITNAGNAVVRPPMTAAVQRGTLKIIRNMAIVTNEKFVTPEDDIRSWVQQFASKEDSRQHPNNPTAKLLLGDQTSGLPKTTAGVPRYSHAARMLGLNPQRPTLFTGTHNELELKLWQAQGVAFMIMREQQHLIPGGVNSDACGVGKTIQALSLVSLAPELVGPGNSKERPYRPTLILAPASVIDVWVTECRAHFGDSLAFRIFHRSRRVTSDGFIKDYIIDPGEFGEWLDSLDYKDISTARVVVITSYTTWRQRSGDRCYREQQEKIQKEQAKEKEKQKQDDGSTRKRSKFQKNKVRCLYAKYFGRIIADEAHALKDVYSDTHNLIGTMSYDSIWFLTATPLINRVLDMGGYLDLLWRKEFQKSNEKGGSDSDEDMEDTGDGNEKEDEDKDSKEEEEGEGNGDDDDDDDGMRACVDPYRVYPPEKIDPSNPPVHLLSPTLFRSNAKDGDLDIMRARVVLPPLMKMLFMGRDLTDVVEYRDTQGMRQRLRIGSIIPPYHVTTVELKMDAKTQEEHDELYVQLMERMERRGKSGDGTGNQLSDGLADPAVGGGTRDFRITRRLSQLAFSPRLEQLMNVTGNRNLSADIREWQRHFADHGATFYYMKTRRDRAVLPPTDSMAIAYYLAFDSPKLRYLAGLMLKIVIEGGGRLLIYANWPATVWKALMFVFHSAVTIGHIGAGMSLEERNAMARQFADPDSNLSVLITTYQCGASGLNLHTACSAMVLLEPARNVNTMLQAMGRLHRIGQQREQDIYILFNDHTFDRSAEFNCAKKMIRQVAADHASTVDTYDAEEEQDEEEILQQFENENNAEANDDNQGEEDDENNNGGNDTDDEQKTGGTARTTTTPRKRSSKPKQTREEKKTEFVRKMRMEKRRDRIQNNADRIFRSMLGQSRTRLGWNDWNDLGHKVIIIKDKNTSQGRKSRDGRIKPMTPSTLTFDAVTAEARARQDHSQNFNTSTMLPPLRLPEFDDDDAAHMDSDEDGDENNDENDGNRAATPTQTQRMLATSFYDLSEENNAKNPFEKGPICPPAPGLPRSSKSSPLSPLSEVNLGNLFHKATEDIFDKEQSTNAPTAGQEESLAFAEVPLAGPSVAEQQSTNPRSSSSSQRKKRPAAEPAQPTGRNKRLNK